MADKDPYSVLGVDRKASPDEIKRAYRRLAKEFHPDQNKGNPKAADRFKEVQAAYSILSDPKKREQFDRFGTVGPFAEQGGPGGARQWRWSGGSPGGGQGQSVEFDFGDLSDLFGGGRDGGGGGSIFEELLGGGRKRRNRGRGARVTDAPPASADIEQEVTLEFDQAIHGTTLRLSIQTPGGGSENVDVRIPPGVSDGQRIRVRGKGGVLPNGTRGDLYIVVRTRPHAYFRREGNDIYVDLPLTITEASLGAKVSVPTLDGSTLVTIPPGTSSGKKLRLAGRGVRNARTQVSGDQYAVIKIVAPSKLTAEQRKVLEELAKTDLGNPREGSW